MTARRSEGKPRQGGAKARPTEPPTSPPKSELTRGLAHAIGRLVGGDDLSIDVGLGLIGVYGEVKGDSILTGFIRGALERRAEQRAAKEAPKPATSTQPQTKPTASVYSFDDYFRRVKETPR